MEIPGISTASVLTRLWALLRRGHSVPMTAHVPAPKATKDSVRIEVYASEDVVLDSEARYAPRSWRHRLLSRLRLRSSWRRTTIEPPLAAGVVRGNFQAVVFKERDAPRRIPAGRNSVLIIEKKNLIGSDTEQLRLRIKVLLHDTCQRCWLSFDLPRLRA